MHKYIYFCVCVCVYSIDFTHCPSLLGNCKMDSLQIIESNYTPSGETHFTFLPQFVVPTMILYAIFSSVGTAGKTSTSFDPSSKQICPS